MSSTANAVLSLGLYLPLAVGGSGTRLFDFDHRQISTASSIIERNVSSSGGAKLGVGPVRCRCPISTILARGGVGGFVGSGLFGALMDAVMPIFAGGDRHGRLIHWACRALERVP